MPVIREQRTLRIGVVFGGEADEGLAGILSSLVSGRDADVAGVFVEDRRLFRMAELPFAAEVCRVSAVRRPITTSELERQMKLLALRAEAVVRRVAEGAGTAWSFRRHRGRLSTALEETGDVDFVVVGTARRGLGPSGELHAMARTVRAADAEARRPIAVVFEPSAAGWRAVDAGVELAARTGRFLWVFLGASADEVAPDIRALLEALGPRGAAIRVVRDAEPSSLLLAVDRAWPAFIVLGIDGEDADSERERLESFQRRARCPLVVVRAISLPGLQNADEVELVELSSHQEGARDP
jgi:hypothetical protein